MELNFTSVEIPAATRNRPTEPNPFDEVMPLDENAIQITLDGTSKDQNDNGAAIRKTIAQARRAANDKDRTARVKEDISEQGTGKNKKTVTALTIWTVPKQTRARKNGENTEAAE